MEDTIGTCSRPPLRAVSVTEASKEPIPSSPWAVLDLGADPSVLGSRVQALRGPCVAAALPLRSLRSGWASEASPSTSCLSDPAPQMGRHSLGEASKLAPRPLLDARYFVALEDHTSRRPQVRLPGAGFLAQSAAVPGRFRTRAGPSGTCSSESDTALGRGP